MKRRFLQRFLAVSLSVAVVGTSLPASAADFTDASAGNTVTEDSFEDQQTDSSSETEEDSGQDSAQIVLTPEAETSEQEESGTGENDRRKIFRRKTIRMRWKILQTRPIQNLQWKKNQR